MPAAATPPGPVLGAEESKELHELIKGADSVELKLTVPEDAHRARRCQALGLDPLEAQIRQVFFFDTPDLALEPERRRRACAASRRARATTRS